MPENALGKVFLDFSALKLLELGNRLDACLDRLTEEQIWARGRENENAVGNLVLHLCGNVRQWMISSIGGEPDVRVREREFSARGGSAKAELGKQLQSTLDQALELLGRLPVERLQERLIIQGYDVSVLEAIYHVVEHFSMHTGQIIFATKLLTGAELGFFRHLDTEAATKQ
ncbi:MAG: DUF1572 family protein [Acidobacteriia bacterium]|nr:DUF1572 family protein [Terriglobia bacterium]